MDRTRAYGRYEKTARGLVKEFLSARFPETASEREMLAEIQERRLTHAAVDDALLTLSVRREAEVVDRTANFKVDWRWRAIENRGAPPAGRGDV